MARRNDPASIVAGMGLATTIITELNRLVIELGGMPNDLHRLAKPDSWRTMRKIAETIVEDGKDDWAQRQPIEEFELYDLKAYNALKRASVDTVGDLLKMTEAELLRLPGMKPGTILEIKDKLAEQGLELHQSRAL